MDAQLAIEVAMNTDANVVDRLADEATMATLQDAWAHLESLPQDLFDDPAIQRAVEHLSLAVAKKKDTA